MTISSDYATPVVVNGYTCRNCTDVDNAQKHIDPAHPQSGPYNINARTDPSRVGDPSVTFGGALSGLADPAAPTSAKTSSWTGSQVNLSV